MNPIILIPARMASVRLPDKPLADIGGKPMIVRVWERAVQADIGPVVVACDDARIAEAIETEGGRAVLTDPDLPSGSDRVWAGVCAADDEAVHDVVINLQGDLPTIEPEVIQKILLPLGNMKVDIASLVTPIVDEAEKTTPSVVKPVLSFADHQINGSTDQRIGRALYFTRATAPYGDGELYHHMGLYAFRRHALAKFVSLPPSALEQREKLEQLRALEAGMRIDVAVVDAAPLGVDTQEDLDKARKWHQ